MGIATLFACTEEPIPNTPDEPKGPSGPMDVSYVASFERTLTKADISGTKILWEEGDQVLVMWGEEPQTLTASSAGECTTFPTLEVPSDKATFAVYPASVGAQYVASDDAAGMNASLRLTVPSVQNGKFADANISVARTMNDTLAFKNLCAILRIQVTDGSVKKVVFRSSNGEPIAGEVLVTIADDGYPGISLIEGKAEQEVSINIDGAGTYYASFLPLITLKGYSLQAFDQSENQIFEVNSMNSLPLTRSTVQEFGDIFDQVLQMDWFVTPEGAGTMSGRNWENAISYQQMADYIAANRSAESGTGNCSSGLPNDKTYLYAHRTVHATELNGANFYLAEGEYASTHYVRISFPDQGTMVKMNVWGGYSASSTGKDLSQRNPELYKTELLPASVSGTQRMFYILDFVDITFDGLSFKNGKGDTVTGGGAILYRPGVDDALLVLKNCSFVNNRAGIGGAISQRRGKMVVEGCKFTENSATNDKGGSESHGGGCIYVGGEGDASAPYAELEIKNCEFINNSSSYTGSVMTFRGASAKIDGLTATDNHSAYSGTLAFYSGVADVASSVFENNLVVIDSGAGIFCSGDNSLNVSACHFTDNVSEKYAGAISFYGKEFKIKDGCTFTRNKATKRDDGNTYGGAVYLANNSKGEIDGATFTDNTIANSANAKAAYGGSLYVNTGCSMAITNTVFQRTEGMTDRMAYYGGAIGVNAATLTLGENVSFVRCYANDAGAIYTKDSHVQIKGATFKSNKADNRGGAIRVFASSYSAEKGISSELVINDSYFADNIALDGGALSNDANASMMYVNNCQFTGNQADQYGGVFRGETHTYSGAFFNNCKFYNNKTYHQSSTSANGTALYIKSGFLCVNNSSFYENDTSQNWDRSINCSNPNSGSVFDTGLIVTNCTFKNDGASQAICPGAYSNSVYNLVLNNAVLINGGNKAIQPASYANGKMNLFGGYNVLADISSCNLTGWPAGNTDLTTEYARGTDKVVGKADDNALYNESTHVLSLKEAFLNPMISYTALETAIKAAKLTPSNAFQEMKNFGEQFYTWLTVTLPSKGYKDGLKYDINDTPRPTGASTTYWPGCVQGN